MRQGRNVYIKAIELMENYVTKFYKNISPFEQQISKLSPTHTVMETIELFLISKTNSNQAIHLAKMHSVSNSSKELFNVKN